VARLDEGLFWVSILKQCRQITAEVEQLVLNAAAGFVEARAVGGINGSWCLDDCRANHPDTGHQFIDGSVAFDSQRVLANLLSADKSSVALVARLGINPIQSHHDDRQASMRDMTNPEVRFSARAVLIDAGFTLVVYDGVRMAQIAAQHGVAVDAAAIADTEPALRRRMNRQAWSFGPTGEGAKQGVILYQTILEIAAARGTPEDLARAGNALWEAHLQRCLWDRILPGVEVALDDLRERGLKLVVVSNSEGNLEAMMERVGLKRRMEAVLDSTVFGVAKPDPRIYLEALRIAGVSPQDAVMVGDSVPADVEGPRKLGIAAALLDPHGLFPNAPAPRFPDFAAFAATVHLRP
jgi:HAD superfamily hydrolase (TIGR01509 family)